MTEETKYEMHDAQNEVQSIVPLIAQAANPAYALMIMPKAEQHECHCAEDAPCRKSGVCACKWAALLGRKE